MDTQHFAYMFFSWWTFCFHLLAIMNTAAVNSLVQVLYIFISVGYIHRIKITGAYNSTFKHVRKAKLFSKVAAPFYIPISSI